MILLGMPVLQIILFGFAITTELNHSRVAVLDPSKDAVTTRITERIDENRYFSVVKELSSASDIETVFRHDEADIVVALHSGFRCQSVDGRGRHTTGGGCHGSEHGQHDGRLRAGHCRASLAIRDAIKSHRADPSLVQSSDEERLQFRTRRDGVDTDADLCDDDFHFHCTRERDRYDGSPVGVAHPAYFIILAKAVPYLVLSCVNLATILLLSVYVLHVPVEGSLWTLSFLSLLLIAVALSLGLLISCVVQNQVAAMIVSGMGLMMPVMLLSGMIFPIESMPAVLQWISNIIPARWYIQAVKKVMIEGLGHGRRMA